MRKTLLVIIALLVVIVTFQPILNVGPSDISFMEEPVEFSRFSGGDGSLGDPFKISNVTELQWMRNNSNHDKHFILINDIDASETRTWNWDGSRYLGFMPIGYSGDKFRGSFHGNNYTISGVYSNLTSSTNVGLFGYVGSVGLVQYLNVVDSNFTGYQNTGGIASYNDGLILNCSYQGNVTSTYYKTGGLVGYNFDGTIRNCTASVNVTSLGLEIFGMSGMVNGGLVGVNDRTIANSCAYGYVYGKAINGGLIGLNYGTVMNCSVNINVTGESGCGFVGGGPGNVKDSYAIGNITVDYSGEGFGYFGGTNQVVNSYYCINYTTINDDHNVTPYGIYKGQFDKWLQNGKSIDIDDYLTTIPGTNNYSLSNTNDFENVLPFIYYDYNSCVIG